MITELSIKALGQTIEYEGETILAIKNMPVNCMVLFVDMETWQKIKDSVKIDVN